MSYKVSILVPVYGVEQYIERCVRSLFEQDYENLEYIFVDDCSPDHSIEVLEKTLCDYPNRKDQVRIIRHEKNRGLGAARNTAVKNASGLFVMHCDSDDWMDTKAVSLLVERQIATDADIVSGKTCWGNKNGIVEKPEYKNKEELLFILIKRGCSITILRRLIRKSLYDDFHIEVQEGVNCAEDYQLIPKLMYFAKSVAWIDQIVYYYNTANSTSYVHRLDVAPSIKEQHLTSFDIVRDFFEDKEKIYYTAASEKTIYEYFVYARDAARQRNRAFFEKCNAVINGKYAEYQYVLGYQNPLKKWFQQQYWIYGLVLKTRSFVLACVKKVFGKNAT